MAWAGPTAAQRYCAQHLSAEDAQRALLPRGTKAWLDWQVSRALLQQFRPGILERACSLSHSSGHAVCVAAPSAWRVGIDLERIKTRDVFRLANWVCSKTECQVLNKIEKEEGELAKIHHFYLLWTLKEAFIKAANLDFPGDMARVGLEYTSPEKAILIAPSRGWHVHSWLVGLEWVVSVVFNDPSTLASNPIIPRWHTMPGCELPDRELIFSASTV